MQAFFRLAALLIVFATALAADSDSGAPASGVSFSEFHFVRLIYTAVPGSRRNRWFTDAPAAETNLMQGVRRLSRINAAEEATYITIMDDSLFDYPWVYAVEVGGWLLSEPETARLRDYLLRGGFLVVDDFHGTTEWDTFIDSMRRVFPDRPIVEIPQTDSVFHLTFELDARQQIPGLAALVNGVTYEKDGYLPHWRGIYDDNGRLMVVINFNMDLGDSWELADDPEYPLHYTASGYQYAINYMIYAMTH
jgi:hypothetical protein